MAPMAESAAPPWPSSGAGIGSLYGHTVAVSPSVDTKLLEGRSLCVSQLCPWVQARKTSCYNVTVSESFLRTSFCAKTYYMQLLGAFSQIRIWIQLILLINTNNNQYYY